MTEEALHARGESHFVRLMEEADRSIAQPLNHARSMNRELVDNLEKAANAVSFDAKMRDTGLGGEEAHRVARQVALKAAAMNRYVGNETRSHVFDRMADLHRGRAAVLEVTRKEYLQALQQLVSSNQALADTRHFTANRMASVVLFANVLRACIAVTLVAIFFALLVR